jgi:steroid delta-isomerase-like uncharacterized protein
MSTDSKTLARRYFEELLTSPGRLTVADEILAPDVVFHNPISATGIHGIEEYKQFALRWYKGFPDRIFTINDSVAEGDKIAVRFTITGTHQGEFMGAAPTGNKITVNGMNLFRIEDGKIADVQAFFNPTELTGPLGISPQPAPSGPSGTS